MALEDKADELKGKAKEGLGKLTGDEAQQVEGKAEQLAAQASGKLKDIAQSGADKVGEAVDKVKDAAKDLLNRD